MGWYQEAHPLGVALMVKMLLNALNISYSKLMLKALKKLLAMSWMVVAFS